MINKTLPVYSIASGEFPSEAQFVVGKLISPRLYEYTYQVVKFVKGLSLKDRNNVSLRDSRRLVFVPFCDESDVNPEGYGWQAQNGNFYYGNAIDEWYNLDECVNIIPSDVGTEPEKTYKGYIATITEIEEGWSRPDGYLICLDIEKGMQASVKDRGYLCCGEDFYCFAGKFRMCTLNEAGYKAILENCPANTVWFGGPKEQYVIEDLK